MLQPCRLVALDTSLLAVELLGALAMMCQAWLPSSVLHLCLEQASFIGIKRPGCVEVVVVWEVVVGVKVVGVSIHVEDLQCARCLGRRKKQRRDTTTTTATITDNSKNKDNSD